MASGALALQRLHNPADDWGPAFAQGFHLRRDYDVTSRHGSTIQLMDGSEAETRPASGLTGGGGFVARALVPVGAQNFHFRAEGDQARGNALVFFHDAGDGPVDRALADEALQFLVSAQAQHLFSATGGVQLAEIGEDDLEEGLEFKGGFGRKHRHQFFSDFVRSATREKGAGWFGHYGL